MTRSFLAPNFAATEISALTGFADNRLDRWAEARDANTLPNSMVHSEARFWGHAKGRVIVAFEDRPRGLLTRDELAAFSPHEDRAVLLGYDGDTPRIAMPLAVDIEAPLPAPYKAIDLRSLAMQGLLPDAELGQVAHGGSLLNWHSSARFCGRCGGSTAMRDAGAKRHCPACARDTFPRTDPVVIMLIVSPDGDRCLLGRSPHFPPGMVTALAGFVEAGETLEMAVRRETFEESGLRVGTVSYHASQPWPFPHTLMIGCMGRALETNIIRDETELEACRWYSRTEVLDALAKGTPPGTGEVAMPMPLAIAHRLILDWAEGRAEI